MSSIDAIELGLIGSSLGAGRAKAGDIISYEVGFKLLKKEGDSVEMSIVFLDLSKRFLKLLNVLIVE